MSVKSFVDFVKAAEATTKREPKMEALRQVDDAGQELIHYALNPYLVFGIKKWPKIKNFSEVDCGSQPFIGLLKSLASRELTGHAARDAVILTLMSYTEETAKYLARVIDKNLKCGVTETTINKVFPNLVPTFGIMLAQKVTDKFKFYFPTQGEFKMDGARLAVIVEDGKVNYLSRSGKPSDFCIGLFEDELIDFENYIGYPYVIDSEVLASNFTETINAKKSTNDVAKANLRIFAFDIMSLEDWKNKDCKKTQTERSEFLANVIKVRQYKKIIKSTQKTCYNMEELKEFYGYALELGFEGLILKEPEGLYEWDRSENWYKWKPIIDVDLTITGVYEGKADTKNEGKLGGFNVEGYDENGLFIKTNVGSLKVGDKKCPLDSFIQDLAEQAGVDLASAGTTTDEFGVTYPCRLSNDEFFRTYVWEHPNEFIDRTVHIQAQELSVKEDRPDEYSLRFPVLYNFRDDK